MGREKPALDQAAFFAADPSGPLLCGVCGEEIDTAEEYLDVHCNTCGTSSHHRECAIAYLLARVKEKTNSNAVTKYQSKARKQPVQIFEQHLPCPNTFSHKKRSVDQGARQPGSASFHGKLTASSCAGFTTGGDYVKPVKEPPAPLPPILPARPHKKQAGAAPAGTLAPPKKLGTPASSASSSSTHLARGANIVPQPGAGAAARLLGPRRPQPRTARGARGKGGGESLPPGPQPPLELRLCPHLLGSGECRVINCQCAHSEQEQLERQQAWATRQEAKKMDARRQKNAPSVHARLHDGDEALLRAQLESLKEDSCWSQGAAWAALPPSLASDSQQPPPHALDLFPYALGLLRAFKSSNAFNTLLEMGFPADRAQAAADAAGADLEAAAQLLMDSLPCTESKEVDLSRELASLASAAAEHGASAEEVEAQVIAMGGNVEAVCEALQSGWAQPAADAPSSEPDTVRTPSLGVASAPAWAADASSTLSEPSPGPASPRGAATAAAPPYGMDPSPGVLSLADFSSSPGLGSMLEPTAAGHETRAAPSAAPPGAAAAAGWGEGLFAFDARSQPASQASAAPTFDPASQASTAHTPHVSHAGGSHPPIPICISPEPGDVGGYRDGYAAGVAAAQSLLHPHPAQAVLGGGAAGLQGHALMPSHQPPAPAEEEIDDLMQMLGIA